MTTSNAKLPLSNLIATGGTGQVALSWTDPNSPSNGARIQRSFVRTVEGNAPSNFLDIATTAGTSYTDTTAKPGTTYAYRVYPINPAPMFVEAPASNVAIATVAGETSPHTSVAAKFGQWPSPVVAQPYPVTDGTWGV